MNREDFKDIIDEIIYESLIGKNPFKEGDLVKLRPYTFHRYGRNQIWRDTLQRLEGKVGKVTKVFPNSKHVNVQYPEKWQTQDEHGRSYTVNTIGIEYTNLVPAENPEKELGEVSQKDLVQTLPRRPSQYKYDDKGNLRLDKMTLDNLAGLKAKVVRAIAFLRKQPDHNPEEMKREVEEFRRISDEIKRRLYDINAPVEEGYGAGTTKDIKSDTKHTKNKTTGKVQRWTVKFDSKKDLKKHGYKGKSPVKESINFSGIKDTVNEILNEMWIGWEEGKTDEPNEPTTLYKHYKDLVDRLGGQGKTGEMAKQKLDQILANVLSKKKVNEEDITHKDDIKAFTPGTPSNKSYIIFAKSGPSTVYYVQSPTQGERMVQNAQSMAYRFPTEEAVRNKMNQLKQKYKGITGWNLQIVGPKTWEGVWHSVGPKVINLGHQVTKPTKNRETGEWVVKWFTDGKKDESKTYYTDDQKDANDTYLAMSRQAAELNKQG